MKPDEIVFTDERIRSYAFLVNPTRANTGESKYTIASNRIRKTARLKLTLQKFTTIRDSLDFFMGVGGTYTMANFVLEDSFLLILDVTNCLEKILPNMDRSKRSQSATTSFDLFRCHSKY